MCAAHQTASEVTLDDGSLGRFCQLCHVVQPAAEFYGEQRTCAASLARHNARRRERKRKAAADLVSGFERVGSETNAGASGGGTNGASGHSSEPGSPHGGEAAPAAASPPDAARGVSLVLRPVDGGADLGSAIADVMALQRFTVEVKLPHCHSPASLPAGDVLRTALGVSLGASLLDSASVSIAPGCVRLVIDCMTDQPQGNGAKAAHHLAAVLRRTCGAAAAGARAAGLRTNPAPAALLPLAAVLLPPNGDITTVPAPCSLPAGARLAVRCAGRDVRCGVSASGTVTLQRLTYAVPGAGGCLLVEARGSDGERLHRPRAVVASRNPALVAELNAAAARGDLPEDVMQAVLHALGEALRPNAPWAVQRAGAEVASRAGWGATLAGVCAAAEATSPGGGDVLAVVASPHAGSPAAMAALHAVAPAAAWADAAARLRTALGVDAFEQPHLAAYGALTAAQAEPGASPAVVRLLAAMHTLLLRTAEDEVDVALDAADAADDAAAYEAFRALHCAHEHFVAHTLGLFGFVMRLSKTVTVLIRDAWPTDAELGRTAAAILRGMRLHPLQRGLPLVDPRSVPWPTVLASLRVFVAYSVLFLLPNHIAAFTLSWRLRAGRAPSARVYYAVYGISGCFVYLTGHLLGDLCIMAATGAAPEWPVGPPTLLHAFFLLWVWRKAIFVPSVVRMNMAWCFICFMGPLLAVEGPRVVFANAAHAVLAFALAVTAALAGRRERAMQAAWVASARGDKVKLA